MKLSEKIKQAQDINTSPETLALLAQDKDTGVRYCVTENTSTASEILALLAQDKNESVREAAKQNKNYIKQKKRNVYDELEKLLQR